MATNRRKKVKTQPETVRIFLPDGATQVYIVGHNCTTFQFFSSVENTNNVDVYINDRIITYVGMPFIADCPNTKMP